MGVNDGRQKRNDESRVAPARVKPDLPVRDLDQAELSAVSARLRELRLAHPSRNLNGTVGASGLFVATVGPRAGGYAPVGE